MPSRHVPRKFNFKSFSISLPPLAAVHCAGPWLCSCSVTAPAPNAFTSAGHRLQLNKIGSLAPRRGYLSGLMALPIWWFCVSILLHYTAARGFCGWCHGPDLRLRLRAPTSPVPAVTVACARPRRPASKTGSCQHMALDLASHCSARAAAASRPESTLGFPLRAPGIVGRLWPSFRRAPAPVRPEQPHSTQWL